VQHHDGVKGCGCSRVSCVWGVLRRQCRQKTREGADHSFTLGCTASPGWTRYGRSILLRHNTMLMLLIAQWRVTASSR
jgi:hypothetical protein